MAKTQLSDALDFFNNKSLRHKGNLKPIGAKATSIIARDSDPLAKPNHSKIKTITRESAIKSQKENITDMAHYKNVIKYFLAHCINKDKIKKVAQFIEKTYNIKSMN